MSVCPRFDYWDGQSVEIILKCLIQPSFSHKKSFSYWYLKWSMVTLSGGGVRLISTWKLLPWATKWTLYLAHQCCSHVLNGCQSTKLRHIGRTDCFKATGKANSHFVDWKVGFQFIELLGQVHEWGINAQTATPDLPCKFASPSLFDIDPLWLTWLSFCMTSVGMEVICLMNGFIARGFDCMIKF